MPHPNNRAHRRALAKSKAARRLGIWRKQQQAAHLDYPMHPARRETFTSCSCHMCGNPRHTERGVHALTRPEYRAHVSACEQFSSLHVADMGGYAVFAYRPFAYGHLRQGDFFVSQKFSTTPAGYSYEVWLDTIPATERATGWQRATRHFHWYETYEQADRQASLMLEELVYSEQQEWMWSGGDAKSGYHPTDLKRPSGDDYALFIVSRRDYRDYGGDLDKLMDMHHQRWHAERRAEIFDLTHQAGDK